MSRQVANLLQNMIRVEVKARLSIEQVLHHPWLHQHYLYNTPLLHKAHNEKRHSAVLSALQGYGFPEQVVSQQLEQQALTHVHVCYFLLYESL